MPRVSEYDRAYARVTVALGMLSKSEIKRCLEAWVGASERKPQPLREYLAASKKLSSADLRKVEDEVQRLAVACPKCNKPRFLSRPNGSLKGPCPHCNAAPAGRRTQRRTRRESRDAPLVRQVGGRDSSEEDSEDSFDFHSDASRPLPAAPPAQPDPPSPRPEPSRTEPRSGDAVGKAWRQLKGRNIAANLRQEDDEPARTIKIGSTIGSYEITNKLGQGGMGVVYLGVHKEMRREAAIKVLPVKAEGSRRKLDAFKKEAQVLARLDHANIIGIYDVGIDGDYAFIAMELAANGSVLDKIGKDKRLRHQEAARILLECARALAKVHAEGLVHRDIKPANILLGTKDAVKLTDFGLVRDEHLDPNKSYFAGKIVGSPAYMSPEQADCRPLDHRTDLYALGVTAFHMLAGHPPFKGKSAVQVLVKQMREAPPRIRDEVPEVPEYLEELILGLMAKNPEFRPQSADQLIEALRSKRFMREKVDKAHSINQPLREAKKAKGSPVRKVLAAPRRESDLLPAWLQRIAVIVIVLVTSYALFPLDEAIRVYVKGEDQVPMTHFDRTPQDELNLWRTRFQSSPIPAESLDLWAQGFAARYPWDPWPARAHSLSAELRNRFAQQESQRRQSAISKARVAIGEGDYITAAAALSGWGDTTEQIFAELRSQVRGKLLDDGWCWVESEEGEPFLIQRTEVSREAFAAYVGARGLEVAPPGWSVPLKENLRLPQAGVSFDDALAYAHHLGGDLPRLQEWATVFGDQAFPWGERLLDLKSVNARGTYDNQPLPVDQVLPGSESPHGLVHLAGNVAEWIRWQGAAAVAGGAFCSDPLNCALDAVVPHPPETRAPTIGFRCVIRLESSED